MPEPVKPCCIWKKTIAIPNAVCRVMWDFNWWKIRSICKGAFLKVPEKNSYLSYFWKMEKIRSIQYFFERNGFAVSSRLAELLGMKVKSVRLFFIYASFTTLVGGFIIYLTLAFWLKLKDMIYTKRSSVFDL